MDIRKHCKQLHWQSEQVSSTNDQYSSVIVLCMNKSENEGKRWLSGILIRLGHLSGNHRQEGGEQKRLANNKLVYLHAASRELEEKKKRIQFIKLIVHDQACELSSLLDASNGEPGLSCCIQDVHVFDEEWLFPRKDHKYLRFFLQPISNNVWRLKKTSSLRCRIVIHRDTCRKNVAALFIRTSRKTPMSVDYVG